MTPTIAERIINNSGKNSKRRIRGVYAIEAQ